jgi:hypothetical protein
LRTYPIGRKVFGCKGRESHDKKNVVIILSTFTKRRVQEYRMKLEEHTKSDDVSCMVCLEEMEGKARRFLRSYISDMMI